MRRYRAARRPAVRSWSVNGMQRRVFCLSHFVCGLRAPEQRRGQRVGRHGTEDLDDQRVLGLVAGKQQLEKALAHSKRWRLLARGLAQQVLDSGIVFGGRHCAVRKKARTRYQPSNPIEPCQYASRLPSSVAMVYLVSHSLVLHMPLSRTTTGPGQEVAIPQ